MRRRTSIEHVHGLHYKIECRLNKYDYAVLRRTHDQGHAIKRQGLTGAGRVNRNDVPPGCDRSKHRGLVSAWLKLDSKGLGKGGRQGGAGGMYRGVV
jgi:hypothetical protein